MSIAQPSEQIEGIDTTINTSSFPNKRLSGGKQKVTTPLIVWNGKDKNIDKQMRNMSKQNVTYIHVRT